MSNNDGIEAAHRSEGLPMNHQETDSQYLKRIDHEIAEGLRDLETENVLTVAENKADMDRFMTELRNGTPIARTVRR